MIRKFLKALNGAFVSPTTKQMEAYGRYAHNLSAACIIADATIYFSSQYSVVQVFGLFAAGVIFFLGGAVLSRGE